VSGFPFDPIASLELDRQTQEREQERKQEPEPEGNLKPWPNTYLADIIARNPTPPPDLIPGLMRKRMLALFVGIEGGGKTALLLDLACRLALGQLFLGFKTLPSSVGLVTPEHLHSDIRARAEALGLPQAPVKILTQEDLAARYIDVTSRETKDLERLIAWAQGLDLVILDPRANVDQGTEDQPGNASLLRASSRLIIETGATVLLSTHVPKIESKETVHRARGHTNLTGAADLVMLLEKHRGSWQFSVPKTKNTKRPEPLYLATSKNGDLGWPITVREAPPDQAEQRQANLAAIVEASSSTWMGPAALLEAAGIKVVRATQASYMTALVESGELESNGAPPGKGRKYRLASVNGNGGEPMPYRKRGSN